MSGSLHGPSHARPFAPAPPAPLRSPPGAGVLRGRLRKLALHGWPAGCVRPALPSGLAWVHMPCHIRGPEAGTFALCQALHLGLPEPGKGHWRQRSDLPGL